jgi:hypothetical protein
MKSVDELIIKCDSENIEGFKEHIRLLFEISYTEHIDVIVILYTLQSLMAKQPISSLMKPLCDKLQPTADFLSNVALQQHKLLGGDMLDIQVGLWYSLSSLYYEFVKEQVNTPEFAYTMRSLSDAAALHDKKRIHKLFYNQHQDEDDSP